MNFDNIKIPNHVKVNYLERKWYGKYLCKLVFQIDKTKLIKSSNNNSYYSFYRSQVYLNRSELVNTLGHQIKNKLKNDDFRMRMESYHVTLFTNDEVDVQNVIYSMGNKLQSIDRPLNEAHINLVTNHTKVLVRKSLFEGKYKFKIYFKSDWKEKAERYPKIKEWVDSLQCDYKLNNILEGFFNTKRPIRNLGYTIAVYLNDPGDLMMCQLRFNDSILKVEEAVLLEELESKNKTA